MKRFRKFLSLLCAVMMIFSSVPVYGENVGENVATPTDLSALVQTLKVGETWEEGWINPGLETAVRLTVETAGPVHVLAEGSRLTARVFKDAEDLDLSAEPLASEKADPETDKLHLTWKAEAENYLLLFAMPEGASGKFSLKTMNEDARRRLRKVLPQNDERGSGRKSGTCG